MAQEQPKQVELLKGAQKERLGILTDEERARKVAREFPLNMHFEMVKHAFDMQKQAMFIELQTHAFARCDYRRLEVPYICDIDFDVSNDINVNVRNGYEAIPIDLNEAALKQEISKLRNTKQETNDSEEDAKTKDEKSKGKGPTGKKGAGELEEGSAAGEIVTRTGFKLLKKELEKVEHQFTYMVIKRTANPKNAIFNIQVVVADEHLGPNLPKSWKCIAVPINQYTGIRATYHTVPYLCFQQSEGGLSEESEKKSLVVDLKPIISRSPFIRPEYGYKKIDMELRQVPKEFIKLNNIDYVFVSYMNDDHFYSTEKLVYIFKSMHELENTLNKNKIASELDEAKCLIMANFGYEQFEELAGNLKRALEGPLGEKLLIEEFDLLFKISFHIWKSFISPVLVQIDHFYYLRSQREVFPEETKHYEGIINDHLKPSFIDLLQIFIKIVSSNEYEQDILWISKMGLELAKLLEEKTRFKEASQTLRRAYDKIGQYRDEKMQRRLKSELDLILPFSLTCSNEKIEGMVKEMRQKYFEWKLTLERTIRRTVGMG